MGVHRVGTDRPAELRVDSVGPFEGGWEIRAEVTPGVAAGDAQLSCARVICQKGGDEQTGNDCLMCGRYRGWRAGPGRDVVTIRCRWSHLDPVWARMTRAGVICCVPPSLACDAADELALRNGVRHLLVTDGGELVGMLCRCDLFAAGDRPVSERMSTEVFAIDAGGSLGEAVAAMSALKIGCLPVFMQSMVVGILTRGDLRRAGVEESLLGARYCSSCRSPHGVRKHPRLDIEFCLDCLAREHSDDDELGGGD